MGGKDFCSFLQQLQAASPALSARELPTLHALSALAAEFQPVSTSAESAGPPLMLTWHSVPSESLSPSKHIMLNACALSCLLLHVFTGPI